MERRKVIKGIAAAAGVIYARPEILALGLDPDFGCSGLPDNTIV